MKQGLSMYHLLALFIPLESGRAGNAAKINKSVYSIPVEKKQLLSKLYHASGDKISSMNYFSVH